MSSQTTSKKNKTNSNFLRTSIIVLLVGIAGGILLSSNLLFWTANTIVDNQKFTAATSPLIKTPSIQKSLAAYTTDQLFQGNYVQNYISQALPPKAAFLAPSIADQLKPAVNKQLVKTFENPKVQNAWNNALTKSHDLIIKAATNYQGNGTIDLSQFFKYVTNNISNPKLSFLKNISLPPKFGNIVIINSSLLPSLHKIIINITNLKIILMLAFVISTVAAIWISKRKRIIIIKISFLYSFLMISTVVGLRIIKLFILNNVNPDYKLASSDAYSIIMKSYYQQTFILLAVFVAIGFIAWITGQYKSAIKLRHITKNIFSADLHSLIFKKENNLTRWVAQYSRIINWSLFGITIIILCFFSLSFSLLLNTLLVVLTAALIVRTLKAESKNLDK